MRNLKSWLHRNWLTFKDNRTFGVEVGRITGNYGILTVMLLFATIVPIVIGLSLIPQPFTAPLIFTMWAGFGSLTILIGYWIGKQYQ